jgi:hypothetical protein
VCGGQRWRRGDALATNLDVVSFAGRSPVAPVYEVRANRTLFPVLVVCAGITTACWKSFGNARCPADEVAGVTLPLC